MNIDIPTLVKSCGDCGVSFDTLSSLDGASSVYCSDCALDRSPRNELLEVCSSCAIRGNRLCFHSIV